MTQQQTSHYLSKSNERNNADAVLSYLASIVESSDDAILGKTLQGAITCWNSSAERLFGYTAGEAIGKAISLILPLDRQQEMSDILARIGVGETIQPYETVRQRKDGTFIRVSLRVSPICDAEGSIIGASTIIHDITAQKPMSEELATRNQELEHSRELEYTQSQLRAIIDASQDALLLLSPGGRPLKVNTRFADFFGLDGTAVLSQSADQLAVHLKGLFEDADALDEWPTWSTEDQEHIFQAILVQREPARREFELSSLPVMHVDQTYIGRLYVWHDVTHEREADRMKTEFVCLVSHELRTPLTSIKGYIDLLLTDDTVGELNELQQEFLGIAHNNARRLISIINDLLDLSRLESGKIELQRKPLDVNQLISELAPSFQLGWNEHRQTFTLHLPEPAAIVLGDANRVMQILSNLLSNAHKYTPDDGSIDLSVETVGNVVSIAVTDSGVGLSNEEQAKLFTRFYRAHNAATATVGGTGLGLVITRSLVEMQGGEMKVSSAPGHGSTFRFTLPLAQPARLPALPRGSLPGKRILVVDDEPDIRRLLQRYLESGGYEVQVAANGEEAFQLATTTRPDLITLDLLLPDSSGLTVLERLKSDATTASIPVVMLTIADDDGQGHLLGATDYLDKPIEAADLLGRIATVLGNQPPHLILLAAPQNEQHELLVSGLRQAGHRVMIVADGRKLLALVKRVHPGIVILDADVSPMGGLALLQALRADPITRMFPVIMTSTRPGSLGIHWHTYTPSGYVDIWGNPSHVAAFEHLFTQQPQTGTSTSV